MAKLSRSQQVFVDFENVSDIELGLIAGLPVKVTLLIGKHQRKLDLALVQQIHRLAGQVVLIEVGAAGRNALDMTLACYLGQAIQQAPQDQFHIVSGDKDYEPLITHLRTNGHNIGRHGRFDLLPFLPRSKRTATARKMAPAAPAAKLPVDRVAKVMARLKNPASRNRPASRDALLKHIKASLGKEASEQKTEAILRELCDTHALTIDGRGKVQYAPVR